MQTSAVDIAKNGIVDQLSALESLAGVTVASADLGAKTPPETFTLADVTEWTHSWGPIGNLRVDEEFTIETFLLIVKPGAGEDTIKAARVRAIAIQAAIEVYLRTSLQHGDATDGITLQGLVNRVEFRPRNMLEGSMANGRFCLIDAGIRVTARLRRGEE